MNENEKDGLLIFIGIIGGFAILIGLLIYFTKVDYKCPEGLDLITIRGEPICAVAPEIIKK